MKLNNKLIKIRRDLHKLPELSNNEKRTSSKIISFLKDYNPTMIIKNIAGNGIICIYNFVKPGPCIVFRAEMDALPIQEKNSIKYKSRNDGISHACGHDGHISILLGLAEFLSKNEKEDLKGKIILLFQPAEETATGAKKIINDKRFQNLKPTHIFGFHNIPSFKLGSVVLTDQFFTSASQGLILRFHGTSSHAGQPEKGNNPIKPMLKCIQILEDISNYYSQKNPGSFITIIHLKLGKEAFGTNPGEGIIMATFRSVTQKNINDMADKSINQIKKTMKNFKVSLDFKWVEEFPAIKNNKECIKIIKKSSDVLKLDVINIKKPFSWSEDFSYYLNQYKGAFFGFGAGKKHTPLHNPNYDFPDDLIEYGVRILKNIILETQKIYDGELN